MWLLPWHVTLSADRKAVLTAIGISLGAAFAFLGLAIPEALDALSSEQEAFLEQTHSLVAAPSAPFRLPSSIDPAQATVVYLSEASLADGRIVVLAAMRGPAAPAVPADSALPSNGGPVATGPVRIVHPSEMALALLPPAEDRFLARSWLIVAPETMARIDPAYSPELATYVLVPRLGGQAADDLRAEGYTIEGVPALESFFASSGREVALDLVLVVAFSSVLIALFSYEFLRSEVRERRREIALWRGIGLNARGVMTLLVGRAATIGICGAALGLLFALALLGVADRMLATEVVRPKLSFGRAALVLVALSLAATIGGLLPAYAATKTTVRELEAEA